MRYLPFSILISLALSPLAHGQPQDPLVEQVRKAIDRGVNYLKLQERGQGNWDQAIAAKTAYPGGFTSLALLALLTSGEVEPSDPVIKRGLAYLRGIEPGQTYVVGLQTMVFALAGYPEDRERIQRNVDWLVDARVANGWTYTKGAGRNAKAGDESNTQYALLGLHEGIRAGAKIDPTVMEDLQKFYIGSQRSDGGWGYRGSSASMTMTTAGVCGLIISGMDVAQSRQQLRADGSAVNCGQYVDNKPVADGLKWVGDRFPAVLDSRSILQLGWPFYCLYGIERTGRLSGQRFFGGHDWYRVGCDYLVKTQQPDGSWKGAVSGHRIDGNPILATSFSLLFLSKGRTPILITKMAHGPGTDWNSKRNDTRNVVEFASREMFKKMPLAWQNVDLREVRTGNEADLRRQLVEELLPSPILYINGHYLRPSDREKAVLRDYLNNGGFLFAEACCGDETFDRDFRALIEELYKDEGVTLKQVPPEHPVWTASGKFAVTPNDPFPLYGIQYGCKWIAMYSPKPLAGYWEANMHDRGNGQKAFHLSANIIAYATGLVPPRPRGSTVKVADPMISKEPIKRNYLEVGQLAHDGDWRPAPRAMRNLMQALRKTGLDVVLGTSRVALSDGVYLDPDEVSSPIRHPLDLYFYYLHGRRSFTPGEKVLKDLRFRLERGGTLLADACCGSEAFDQSFRTFIEKLWPDKKLKLEPIPVDDELFSRALNGQPIETVRVRRPVQKGALPELQDLPPALEGVKYNGRWIIIYSKYDLGCALEGHTSSDCLGHDHDSAIRLGMAAVLYALKR